jgi:hypothetical protein
MNSSQDNLKKKLFSETRLISRQLRAIRLDREGADFLVESIAEDFSHRISAINRKFANAADLFSFSGKLSVALGELDNVSAITRYELPPVSKVLGPVSPVPIRPLTQALTDDETLSGAAGRPGLGNLDLVVSAFGLHCANDLPRLMLAILQSMNKDGLLLIALPVQGTLIELRDSLTRAELELSGGAASRIDPFIDIQQAGKLLQSTGFKLPVVDREEITVRYDDAFALINDLRAMGMTSALNTGDYRMPPRDLFKRANELYKQNHCDEDGRIRASFCFACLTAWSPHENQQQPLKPGSAKVSLASHLKSK